MPLVPCDQCRKPINIKLSQLNKWKRHFCNNKCKSAWLSGKPLSQKTRTKLSNIHKGENNPFFGKKHTQITRDKMSASHMGDKNPNFGKPKSLATRTKMSESKKGIKNPNFGKPKSLATRTKMSDAAKGIKNHNFGKTASPDTRAKMGKSRSGEKNSHWLGGISFNPYCPKFNNNLKERVRKFFNYTCQMCGHKWQPGERKLCVHHINYDKRACCEPTVKPLFAVVCHGKCHNKTNKNRTYWYQHFQELIAIQYGGRCFLPKS